MKNKWLIAVLGAVVLGLGATAQATPTISGSILFSGDSATFDTGNLATATAFTAINGIRISAGTETGTYMPLNGGGNFGGTLSFSTFSFGGNVLSPSPLVPLWTVTLAGVTYSFDATSVHIDTQNGTFLNLSGSGIAHATGFADTIGTWSITDTAVHGAIFSFGASTAVPDGGNTLMLLGSALSVLGFGVFRKSRKA